ncbi:MAG: minor capsid protein [Parabacteroides sp.]|nr:minor capsid protein [Parabacteroides sp.]
MTLSTYLEDLATYLQTQGYGTFGTSILIGYVEGASNTIYLTTYGGSEYQAIKSGEEDVINPDFQILIRNSTQKTAITTSSAVYKLLRKKVEWTLGSTHFMSLYAKGPPIFIRKTDSGYYEYSVNYTALIY